jgi:hypothetical protein
MRTKGCCKIMEQKMVMKTDGSIFLSFQGDGRSKAPV